MKFRAYVEATEPMRGLEVPPEVVEALGGGKRPAVTITINGHSWKSRVAIMGGRYLLGLSKANRQAAGVMTGDEVEVEVEIDAEPRVVIEPADFVRALDADPVARTAYERLSYGRKREYCSRSSARRRPRRAYGGSRRLWQCYEARSLGTRAGGNGVDRWRVVDWMIRLVRTVVDCADPTRLLEEHDLVDLPGGPGGVFPPSSRSAKSSRQGLVRRRRSAERLCGRL